MNWQPVGWYHFRNVLRRMLGLWVVMSLRQACLSCSYLRCRLLQGSSPAQLPDTLSSYQSDFVRFTDASRDMRAGAWTVP